MAPSRFTPAASAANQDANLLDAVMRLVRLVDAPSDYEVLAPLAVREIAYRPSLGEQGGNLGRSPSSAKRSPQ